MLAIWVKVRVKPDQRKRFLEAIEVDALGSEKDEPGCLRFNVLQDDMLRDGVKQVSNWPTIPQLYVDGQFIGGCDIMREMYQSGELQQVLAAQKS